MKIGIFLFLALIFSAQLAIAQEYKLEEPPLIFKPQEKKILLFSKNTQSNKLIIYYSKLRVNTDGTRKSYNPTDFDGKNIAVNSICNGVFVYRKLPDGKESQVKCSEVKEVIERFKLNNWVEAEKQKYRIDWQTVIAGKNGKPCIFQEGEFKGYFGSLTAVKNGLPKSESGECEYKNQLDALTIPNLVLPRATWKDKKTGIIYENPLQLKGVGKEDLVFAFNPENGVWSYAIIGDVGPNDNLGEGSVSLNMKLLGKTDFPKNYTEAIKLDTGSKKILVAIIPNSKGFMSATAKPYTKENIDKRGKELLKEIGFNDEQSFIEFLKKQQSKF
jgi:hypothetical protein